MDEEAEAEVAARPHAEGGAIGGGGGGDGAGGGDEVDPALDWAAAMERDAFESAVMQHGLDDDDDDDALSTGGSKAGGGGAPVGAGGICAFWREIARGEAQRLLRLNDASVRHEKEWQAERDQWQALRAEVQAELRREARSKARSSAAGGAASTSEAEGSDRGEVVEVQQALRRAQAKVRNLRRERAALEGELSRHQMATADVEERLNLLRNEL